MKRSIVIAALAAATVAWGLAGRRVTGSPQATAASAASGIRPGQAAPDFALKTLDGRTVRLSGLRGRVVLVNFWATWCAPCRVEMPWLVEFNRQYRGQGLEIVGIAMDDHNDRAVQDFTRELGVDYTIVLGDNDVSDAYGGAQFLPQSFFVDREGRVVKHLVGIESRQQLEQAIQQAVAGGPSQDRR